MHNHSSKRAGAATKEPAGRRAGGLSFGATCWLAYAVAGRRPV
jgi:hypothetical protein